MPRTCTICTQPGRPSIDAALVAGEAYRHIAAGSGTSTGVPRRDDKAHRQIVFVRAKKEHEMAHLTISCLRYAHTVCDRTIGGASTGLFASPQCGLVQMGVQR